MKEGILIKFSTAYSVTNHCEDAGEIVESLFDLGLGRAVVADECRKIAAANGPRSDLYRQAVSIVAPPDRARRRLMTGSADAN